MFTGLPTKTEAADLGAAIDASIWDATRDGDGPAKRRRIGHGPIEDRHVEKGQRHMAEHGGDGAAPFGGGAGQPADHQPEGIDQRRDIVGIAGDLVCRHANSPMSVIDPLDHPAASDPRKFRKFSPSTLFSA